MSPYFSYTRICGDYDVKMVAARSFIVLNNAIMLFLLIKTNSFMNSLPFFTGTITFFLFRYSHG